MDQLSRRTVLTSGLGVAGGLVLGRVFNAVAQADILDCGPDLIIRGDHVQTSHFVVPAGKILKFELGASLTLDNCSLLVYGTLEGRPGSSIKFTNVNEAGFVGGGMGPVDENDPILSSDPGLWVMGDGVLDIQGTPKVAWNRTGDDPSWSASDELVSTPIQPGDYTTFASFTKGSVVPEISTPFGTRKAEVLNLTRDFSIEGTPTGRSHIFSRSTRPQIVKHASVRHMGPRQITDADRFVLGRWPIHFHHSADGSRLSTIEGVVVRDAGSHALVAHASHGVTFRDCIAYKVLEIPYWWDQIGEDPAGASHDILLERCVGADITSPRIPDVSGWKNSPGDNGLLRECVMVGVGGNPQSSDPAGFSWTNKNGQPVLEDCVAHNNKGNGSWFWMNPTNGVPISRFTCYNNGKVGIEHGAYGNQQKYFDAIASGGPIGLSIKAVSDKLDENGDVQRHVRGKYQGTNYALEIVGHVKDGVHPVRIEECDLRGGIKAVQINETAVPSGKYDFIRCTVNGTAELEPSDFEVAAMAAGSEYRVQRGNGTAYRMNPDGSSTVIPAFA